MAEDRLNLYIYISMYRVAVGGGWVGVSDADIFDSIYRVVAPLGDPNHRSLVPRHDHNFSRASGLRLDGDDYMHRSRSGFIFFTRVRLRWLVLISMRT